MSASLVGSEMCIRDSHFLGREAIAGLSTGGATDRVCLSGSSCADEALDSGFGGKAGHPQAGHPQPTARIAGSE
eukprot:5035270-Alexandrium_andersonii.AAC.1